MKLQSCLLVLLALTVSAPAAHARTVLDGLHRPVFLIRDASGIPHIFAADRHDLFFVQGWVHAQDRLFQMDLFRRQVAGTLAEVLGATALERDVMSRTLGLGPAAQRSLDAHPQSVRDDLRRGERLHRPRRSRRYPAARVRGARIVQRGALEAARQ